jgi:hypothetical protein
MAGKGGFWGIRRRAESEERSWALNHEKKDPVVEIDHSREDAWKVVKKRHSEPFERVG